MSLVLVSPSTESWSQVRAARRSEQAPQHGRLDGASVSTTESIVAMFGWIIPTPLAMPLTVTGTTVPSGPGSSTVVVATLVDRIGRPQGLGRGREGRIVVAPAAATSGATAAVDLVERQPRADDPGREMEDLGLERADRAPRRAARCAAWSASPAGPVAALALPLVETTAVAQPKPPRGSPDVAARLARDWRTGAAANAFGREHGGRRQPARGRHDQREVGPPGGLDPGGQRRRPGSRPAGWRVARRAGGSGERRRPESMVTVVRARAAAGRDRPSRAGRGRG